jgi:molybdenum cofactor cytidylyltransferase
VTRVAGLVLAAGASSRFGSPKALARIDGRPMLEAVLGVARSAGLEPIVVVLGHAAHEIEAGVEWGGARRVRNPDPARGLASSLQVGIDAIAALEPPADAVVVLLGDQPRTSPATIAALVAARGVGRPIVVPAYDGGGGHNPVLLERAAFGLAAEAVGDRGLGPVLDAHPELVGHLALAGTNPDIDTPADLDRV